MSDENLPVQRDRPKTDWGEPPELIIPRVITEPLEVEVPAPPRQRKWKLPLALFVATCLSVYLVGGWLYALCLMTILVCHEAGHFVQAWRYGVSASYPFFLPMPLSPIGTFGAVIAMDSRIKDRKALFDIGITGPLAGLVPTLLCCILGIWFEAKVDVSRPALYQFGEPLLFQWLSLMRFGSIPNGFDVYLGPVAMAGWVGLLVTALNLIPIGQLDGGHVLYALLRRKAHVVATVLLAGAVAAVFLGYYWWSLMVVLLAIMGPRHPPTADDHVPLGPWRIALGWLTLAFFIVGFTPKPM
jgi:membrane-associated protease RseP (regulator of RpoE activity)